MQYCNVIIYSYHYLLDPKIAERVSKDLPKDAIVVFDEAHNIDNVCIESLSTDITEDSLQRASRGARFLDNKINEMRESDQQKLQDEYQKLVQGLRGADDGQQEDSFMANPSMCCQVPYHCIGRNNTLTLSHAQSFLLIFSRRLFRAISGGQNTLWRF
jgi:DNA excision repair protein ERCC-2